MLQVIFILHSLETYFCHHSTFIILKFCQQRKLFNLVIIHNYLRTKFKTAFLLHKVWDFLKFKMKAAAAWNSMPEENSFLMIKSFTTDLFHLIPLWLWKNSHVTEALQLKFEPSSLLCTFESRLIIINDQHLPHIMTNLSLQPVHFEWDMNEY